MGDAKVGLRSGRCFLNCGCGGVDKESLNSATHTFPHNPSYTTLLPDYQGLEGFVAFLDYE